jgi:LPS O-antigen subunit length determinant protein (WzzB/FepE family)
MERLVTESPPAPKRDRIVRLTEGVLVGVAVGALVVLGFNWLMTSAP